MDFSEGVKPKIKRVRLKEFWLLLILKALLEIAYVHFVNPRFEYMGFGYDLNLTKLLESYLFISLLFFLLPSNLHKISTIGLQLLFLLVMLPTLSYYGLNNQPRLYPYFFVGSFCLTILTVNIFPAIRIKGIRRLNVALFFLLGILTLFIYTALIKLNGMPTLKALALSTVHELRRELDRGPGIMRYMTLWQAYVVNTFLLGLAWYKRRYFALISVLGLQVLIFLICPHKSFLLGPLIVLFLLYGIRRQRLMTLSLASLILIVLVSLALSELNVTIRPASTLIRRAFFSPARTSFWYYGFFSENEHIYLSTSKAGLGLGKNPYAHYDMSVANMMGMIYRDRPEQHVNTGYLGNAYMHFGFIGMVIFSAILGLVLVTADSICKTSNIYLATAALALPILSIVNGGLLPALLSKGLLLGLFIIWLSGANREGCNSGNRFDKKKFAGNQRSGIKILNGFYIS